MSRPISPKFKFLLDLGPLAVFFVAYKTQGLMAATAALIVASLISLAITYAHERKLAVMPLVTAVVIAVFGGLTLFLQDEIFIKMKPTIVNLLFAAVLLIGLAAGKPMLKYLLGTALHLTEEGWRKLSLRWGIFFLFLACLNEVVWRHFPTEWWVDFKVFGIFPLTLLFTLSQVPMMMRHMIPETKPQ